MSTRKKVGDIYTSSPRIKGQKFESPIESQEDGLPYLKIAKAVAFLILNLVQIIDIGRSAAYTAKNMRRRR